MYSHSRYANRFRKLSCCLIELGMLTIPSFRANADDSRVGLVKEKPAKGPFVETDQGFMVPYTVTIPGSDITFEMIPIPGGVVKMGSPEGEEERASDEGPQVTVKVDPIWSGNY